MVEELTLENKFKWKEYFDQLVNGDISDVGGGDRRSVLLVLSVVERRDNRFIKEERW